MTRDSQNDLRITHHYARKMFLLAEKSMDGGFELNETDHFGFMALCFFYKQVEHARSIGILVDSEQYADTSFLARVMLEGFIILGWANLNPEKRGLLWRSYALISDWKLLQEKLKSGEKIDPEFEADLKKRLSQIEKPFLTKAARNQHRELINDPYQNTWMVNEDGKKVMLSDMVKEIGDPTLYKLYSSLSQFGHWTPKGIGEKLIRTEQKVRIDFNSKSSAAQACAIVMQMLGHTLEVLSSHFGLAINSNVKTIFDEYKKEVS